MERSLGLDNGLNRLPDSGAGYCESHSERIARLLESFRPALVRHARRWLDNEGAEDAAADVVVSMWIKASQGTIDVSDARAARALAYRVIEGRVRNALRSQSRLHRAVIASAIQQRLAALGIEHDSFALSLWHDYTDGLAHRDLEVLALAADGYGTREIAAILKCTPAAVSMRISRARSNCRTLALHRGSSGHSGAGA